MPLDAAQVNLGGGSATLRVTNVALADYTKVPNSLMHGPSVPATLSCTVQWSGSSTLQSFSDAAHGFRGAFVRDTATIEWTASTADFTFTSDAASTSKSLVALLGTERNGAFFT